MYTPTAPIFTPVIKRGGGIKPFGASQIADTLSRAGRITGEFDAAETTRLPRSTWSAPRSRCRGM